MPQRRQPRRRPRPRPGPRRAMAAIADARSVRSSGRGCELRLEADSTVRNPFEDHLVGEACGACAVAVAAHRPGQKRQAEHTARHARRNGRQIVDPIGDEMRAGCGAHAAGTASRRFSRRGTAMPNPDARSGARRRCRARGAARSAAPPRPCAGSNDITADRAGVAREHRGGARASRRSPSNRLLSSSTRATRPATRSQSSPSVIMRSAVALKRDRLEGGGGQIAQRAVAVGRGGRARRRDAPWPRRRR